MEQSWWLKVKRAQRHMVEIEHEMRRYAHSDAYEAVRVRAPKSERHVWIYVLRMTQQPDPMVSTMLGDFVHNLRSALDHIVVA